MGTTDRWKKDDPDIDKFKVCPVCQGLGVIIYGPERIKCPTCNGAGVVRK